MLARLPPSTPASAELAKRLDDELRARVHEVVRLTPKIVEVVVKAPMAARAFQPGQFYRLQNYEAHAQRVDGTTLAMEGLALTGAWIDRNEGLLSRSEEHTSELQSLRHLVCRLLLEKKNR